MDSELKARPTHYEVLGIDPAADEQEIKRAFADKMSLFGAHRIAEVPRISAAFETLRDAAKRKAYDRSLGIGAKAEPQAPAQGWGFAVAPPKWTPFVAPVAAREATPASEPHVTVPPEPETEAPVDPRAAAIAATLRELAKPTAPAVAPDPEPEPELDAVLDDIRAFGRVEKEKLREARPQLNWRKPALAVGGLVLGAGLFGTLAGVSVKDNAEAAQADPALSVALPPAKPRAEVAVPLPAPAGVAEASVPAKPKRVAPQRPSAWAEQMAQSLASDAPAVAEASAEARPAQVVEASIPIPNQVVARTIERIGYACGEVASTSVADAPGVFTVNCTSGQSYQASPVRGRYHFRRLGSR